MRNSVTGLVCAEAVNAANTKSNASLVFIIQTIFNQNGLNRLKAGVNKIPAR